MFKYIIFWTAYWEASTESTIWFRLLIGAVKVPLLIGGVAWVPPSLVEATWGTVTIGATIYFWKTWVEGKVKGWSFFTQVDHVSWNPVACEVLNPQTLLHRHIQFPSERWTPLFLLVSPFPFAFLSLWCCFCDLLVQPFLLLCLDHVLPPSLTPWGCFILLNFFLFSTIFFWYFLWGLPPMPRLGVSPLKQGF